MGNNKYDYFYEEEAEQYSFYRIPKAMFTDPQFTSLSIEAKVLYGLMLDRMSLSRKNQWIDDENRVFIRFTIEDTMELLNCSKGTAIKLLAELDDEHGIGLIQKVRVGFGKPSIIYVKNFITRRSSVENEWRDPEVQKMNFMNSKNKTSRSLKNELQEVHNLNLMKSKNRTSRGAKNELHEVQNLNLMKSKNQTSRSPEFELQEERKLNPNNSDLINTDSSDTNSIIPSQRDVNEWYSLIRKNISYEALEHDLSVFDLEQVDELVDIMVEAIVVPSEFIQIGDMKYPYQFVKDRLLRVDMFTIQYLRRCLKENTTKVKNIKPYLLKSLINASMTHSNHIATMYQHDQAQG